MLVKSTKKINWLSRLFWTVNKRFYLNLEKWMYVVEIYVYQQQQLSGLFRLSMGNVKLYIWEKQDHQILITKNITLVEIML